MVCKNCGKALPSEGITCKFCGALLSQDQLNYQNKMRDKENRKLELLTEKYGVQNKVEYQDKKENKLLGLIVIIVVLLILIVLTICLNI